MKCFIKTNILVLVLLTAVLGSCKNNKDGYSDEIETTTGPVDTATVVSDTINVEATVHGTEAGNAAETNTGSQNSAASTAGKGSGPGESAKDGATYTNTNASDSLKKGYKNKK